MIRWLARAFPKGGLLTDCHPDIRLFLHPQDCIELILVSGRKYEERTLSFIQANLKQGSTAIFAGINFGQHIIVAAKCVGDAGRVFGFEPQPMAICKAARNIAVNQMENRVDLVTCALGDNSGFVNMAWANEENSGSASIFDTGNGFVCSVISLKNFFENRKIEEVSLFLLDVQGFESNVIHGLIGSRVLPKIIIVELDPEFLKKSDCPAENIAKLLIDLGYSLFDLNGSAFEITNWTDIPDRNIVGVLKELSAVFSGS